MLQQVVLQSRRTTLVAIAALLGLLSAVPAFMPKAASAAPAVTERALTSTTARPSQATQLAWTFNTTADAGNAKTIEIQFCDSPLGTCTTVNTPTVANASPTATLSGPWTSTGVTSATRVDGRTASLNGTNNQIDIVKTNADDASTKTGLVITLDPSDIVNNAAPNKSYYTRVRIYSDNPATSLKWEGVFAQSTSQTLTVNARVQERLDFCVGATAVNDADTTTPTPTLGDCRDVAGNTVDIGNIEAGFTNVSPVTTVNGGSNENGIAMVRTNAINGVVVDYKSLQDGDGPNGKGTLKIPGNANDCNGTATTDPCFNAAGTTGTALTAGTEKFGMVVAGVNCKSTAAYTCTFAGGTYNLIRDAEYDGAGSPGNTYVTDANQVPGGTAGQYAWDDTGSADRIASSTGSSVKVVDDEALILKFAATAGVTTPTGAYTVQADFIATTTF